MDWFRFYSSVLTDVKVQKLKPELFRAWVNLLCLANETKPRGTLPSLEGIAFALRTTEAKAEKIVAELVESNLLERDGMERLVPHNWESRQRRSDDVAERVRKHRDKVNVTLHETLQDEERNVAVTPRVRERQRQTQNRTDTDTDASVRESTDTGEEPMQLDGPIGTNSSAQVRETLHTAESLFPMTNVRILARNWLGETTAARIIAALHATAQKSPAPSYPASYAKVLLDDPSFPQARKNGPPSKPHKAPIVLECERMFINPNRPKPETKP